MLDDLIENRLCGAHRNRKTDALCALGIGAASICGRGTRIDRGVDADQFAERVDQRASGIAGVDRGVGLDEILVGRHLELASGGADDAHRDCLAESDRVADRKHDITDVCAGVVRHRDRGQLGGADFKHREVGFHVASDHLCLRDAAIVEQHLDVVRSINHMIVGQYVTV